MNSIADSLTNAEAMLAASGVAESRREAISLLMLATQKDKTFIYSRPEYELTDKEFTTFRSAVERRSLREPLQYIKGTQEFFGLEFEVTPDVLIPRPETEMVVEHAIEILRETPSGFFCDVGTGSGCIAISILNAIPDANAIALDISARAIALARRNAQRHGVIDRIRFIESDVFSAVGDEQFSIIVSNPPYIPLTELSGLQPEVHDHEPHNALTDGSDGLSIIRRLVTESPRFLSKGGRLLLEIGFGQSAAVAEMFDSGRWDSTEIFGDLQGIPRLISARLI